MTQKLFSTQFFGSLISSETSNRFSLSDYFEDAYSREYDFAATFHTNYATGASLSPHPFPTRRQGWTPSASSTRQRAPAGFTVKTKTASTRHMTSPKAHLPSLTAVKPQAPLPAQHLGIHDMLCKHLRSGILLSENFVTGKFYIQTG